MYALEYCIRQEINGIFHCRWRRYALCGSRIPLDKVRAGQQNPNDWRVMFVSCSLREALKNFSKAA